MRILTAFSLLTLLVALPAARGQDPIQRAERTFYKVDFTITDASASAAEEARHFTILTDPSGRGSLRLSSRFPYAVGGRSDSSEATQFQYADVGVTIECTLRMVDQKVALSAEVDVNTVARTDWEEASAPPGPTIGGVRATFGGILEPGAPTTVASIDDPAIGRRFNIRATVEVRN